MYLQIKLDLTGTGDGDSFSMILAVLGLTVGEFQLWVQLQESRSRNGKEASLFSLPSSTTEVVDKPDLALARWTHKLSDVQAASLIYSSGDGLTAHFLSLSDLIVRLSPVVIRCITLHEEYRSWRT